MIQVIFEIGSGMFHHVGGDYKDVAEAVDFAERSVELSPRYRSAVVRKDGEIVAEVN